MINIFQKRLLILFLLLIIGFAVFKLTQNTNNNSTNYPEVRELSGKNLPFNKLSAFFKNLAEKKGASYAFQVLKLVTLPPQTDFHLLGHVVGDVLYKQQGAEGIRVCTEDFRNACSHSIVVGLFSEKGEEALPEITKACKKAPGESGAYTMCFHGLGHGIFASTGYDFPKTVELCKKTSTPTSEAEYIECVGGAVMEIISGGFHDREIWKTQRLKYLDTQDPLRLCNNDFIKSETKQICFTYITPFLFEAVGADLGHPGPKDFEKAFSICNTLPISQRVERDACFGGFGKEFIVLAQNRDIRKIDEMTANQFLLVYDWCKLAKIKEGIASCVISSMNSLYWGGENKKETAINFCKVIDDEYQKNTCFISLTSSVLFFNKNKENYITSFCNALPGNYKLDCKEKAKNITSR